MRPLTAPGAGSAAAPFGPGDSLSRPRTSRFPDPGPLDRAAAIARMGDDLDLYASVCGSFARSAPGRLDALNDAVAAHQLPAAAAVAHSLRGSALTIGAEALACVLQTLERACDRGDLAVAATSLAGAADELRRVCRSIAAAT